MKSGILGAGKFSSNLKIHVYLLTQASIISLAISLSLCSKWWANSCSGQCRSKTNICRASSFQKRSSDVAEPLLEEKGERGISRLPLLARWITTTLVFTFYINCHPWKKYHVKSLMINIFFVNLLILPFQFLLKARRTK